MKYLFYIGLIIIVISACKNNAENESIPTETTKEKMQTVQEEINKDNTINNTSQNTKYVMVPNGLSLRKEANVASEKVAVMPLGSTVTVLENPEHLDITVEGITGGMSKVQFENKTGYAFSGFLSRYPIAFKDESTEDYIQKLKKEHPKIEFNRKETDPDFHQGIIETILIPKTSWHEAYYMAKAMYRIPASLSFPGYKGETKESIEQKDKEEYVWFSTLNVIRSSQKLDTLHYLWRAEGGGMQTMLTKTKEGSFKIKSVSFAD